MPTRAVSCTLASSASEWAQPGALKAHFRALLLLLSLSVMEVSLPQQRKTYSIVEEGEKPIIFPPIHSAHCLCHDLLRVVEDILLYITEMQLNSMGEGEGQRVQAPASSVFLLIYWVTRGRQLCAAISSLENRDVGHSAL